MGDAIDPTVYRLRANAFIKPRIYRLTDDALTWDEEGKKTDGVFYDDISEVRLAFVPMRSATNRYRAQVIFRQGGMVELFNTDYAGFANLVERNAEYSAFVTELHRRLAERGKDILFRSGNSVTGYVGNVALTVFIFVMLALALLLFINWGGPWMAVVKFGIILFFLPVLIRYLRRAKPMTYDPLTIPAAALPEAGGAT